MLIEGIEIQWFQRHFNSANKQGEGLFRVEKGGAAGSSMVWDIYC